jgi:uncharacterized membrane protein/secreted protein with Ig-like and vWFA domain
MTMQFAYPAALVLLAVIPFYIAVAYRARSATQAAGEPRRWRARDLTLPLHIIIAVLLVLALAGLRVPATPRSLAVAFVVDLSASVPPTVQDAAKGWVLSALQHMGPDDLGGIVIFAGDAKVEQAMSKQREHPIWGAPSDTQRTNLAAAIRTAASLFPPGVARRIVLLTDGNETNGRALQSLQALPPGTQIDVVPVPSDRPGSDVAVESVRVPTALRENEPFDIDLALRQRGVPTPTRLTLWIDNQKIAEQELTLNTGTQHLSFSHPGLPLGYHSLRVEATAQGDTMRQNDTAWAFTVVKEKPVVLMVARQPEEAQILSDLLHAQNILVELTTPQQLSTAAQQLARYQAVVLVNVPAGGSGLDTPRMSALEEYVRSFGGGLLVVGGRESYAVGNYQGTPLERALPVSMNPPSKEEDRNVALVLVIDKSGSMGDQQGRDSKMALARESAMQAVDMLRDNDLLGVIAFDDEPSWYTKGIEPVRDRGTRIRIKNNIARIDADRGTNIFKALDVAEQELRRVEARQKHILLLTDGQDYNRNFDQLIGRIHDAQVSLSTIAIGNDADRVRLRQWAEAANGRYYFVDRAGDIPQVVLKEIRTTLQTFVVEKPVRAEAHDRSPVLKALDLDSLPAVQGYVRTNPKSNVEVPLITEAGDPLLAHWQYGLGRAAAWTASATLDWAGDWMTRPELQLFWQRLVRWTMPFPMERTLQVSTSVDGNNIAISVEALEESLSFRNLVPTEARILTPSGTETVVALQQTAPGRYEGRLTAPDQGAYRLAVEQRDGETVVASETTGFVVQPLAEYANVGTNERLLRRIAEETGGKVLSEPAEAYLHERIITREPAEIWPSLLAAALILFIVDVALRRLRIAATDLAYWGRALRRRWLPQRLPAPWPGRPHLRTPMAARRR